MIYVHVPFCRSFCTYCDFYSEVAAKCRKAEDAERQDEMFTRFADALVSEAALRADEITDDVNTLYIGGGTPSVLPLSVFRRLLEALRQAGHGGPYDEFTVEVNPEDIVGKGESYVEGLLGLGVNRISMGVQSFDDGILRFMNRRHDAATARKAYAILENAGVPNISIDLIFGLPQLSDTQWTDTLKQAMEISPRGILPNHVSSYQLSVEEGSMLARMVERGLWHEASDELCSRQYDILCETLHDAGYNHYEISNFALPGFEAVHNSAYWKHVPYVGLGPGAHSFLKVGPAAGSDVSGSAGYCSDRSGLAAGPESFVRQWNRPDLKAYMADPSSAVEYESLTEDQLVLERIMLALRTADGIPADFLYEHCGRHTIEQALAAGNLTHVSADNASLSPSRLRIPESRFFISDSIISELV